MHSACRQLLTVVALIGLVTGPAAASSVVFEKVELFQGKTFFTETFQIGSAGSAFAVAGPAVGGGVAAGG